MTNSRDPYWDELGLAWRPAENDATSVISSLKSRLRRQFLTRVVGLILGVPVTAAGFLIGVLTVWNAWTTGTWNFLVRGSAILIVSTMAARGIWLLLLAFRPARDDRPPADMLALAVASSQRALAIIRLVLAACAVAAIFGLIGTAIRYSIVRPPAQSPVLDTSILAVIATALILYLRQEKVSLLKLQYLNRALTFDSTRETDGQ